GVHEVKQLVARAHELEAEGRSAEAYALWVQIGGRMDSLADAPPDQDFFVYVMVGAGVLVVMAGLFYAARISRGLPGSGKARQREERLAAIEKQRVELVRRYMKREMDYPMYSKLMAGLDEEYRKIQRGAQEKK
ncbi:MAG: hypothetical protein V1787_05490, partial [Candidatus Micrarchaeota archaeon]